MDLKTHLIEGLKGNVSFVTHTLADLTDADMFVRPCPAANHAAWQVGHMTLSEASAVKNMSPEHAVTLPEGFTEAYKMDNNKSDEPAIFAPINTKAQLLDLFTKVRNGTVAWVESMPNEKLDLPTPEKYKSWAPTIGSLAAGQIMHVMMHLGQFQVIRRKLGKPVLF